VDNTQASSEEGVGSLVFSNRRIRVARASGKAQRSQRAVPWGLLGRKPERGRNQIYSVQKNDANEEKEIQNKL